MRALTYTLAEGLQLRRAEPDPVSTNDEALVEVRLAGICHTDLELTRGYMGFQGTLGHEFVGVLAADAAEWKAGQRVVGEINVTCGRCAFCAEGMSSQCPHRVTMGIDRYPGAFADRLRVPIRNLHTVPDSVSDAAAVFTEPLAAAFQVTALAPVHPAQRVIVLGAGKLGLLVAQVLRLTGCDLAVVTRQQRPEALLRKWRIPAIDAEDVSRLKRSAHMVVDCTGAEAGFSMALEMLRPRGTLVLKSTYHGLPQANLTRVVVDEIRVVGSRCGSFAAALRALDDCLIDVESMIEQVYSLDEGLMAFAHAARRGALKVLLRP